MVEINKNTTITEAKKTTAEKNVVEEATEYTELNQVQEDLKGLEVRFHSMKNKNDSLQEKLTIVKEDNLSIIIPREYIAHILEAVVNSRKNELIEKISEAECILDELNLEKNKEALEGLEDLSSISDRLEDIESSALVISDRLDDIESEEYCSYDSMKEYIDCDSDKISEGDVEDMVTNAKDDMQDDFNNLEERIDEAYAELKCQVDRLSTNKVSNKLKRLFSWLKGLFTPRK